MTCMGGSGAYTQHRFGPGCNSFEFSFLLSPERLSLHRHKGPHSRHFLTYDCAEPRRHQILTIALTGLASENERDQCLLVLKAEALLAPTQVHDRPLQTEDHLQVTHPGVDDSHLKGLTRI